MNDLYDENFLVLSLSQALVGAVTPNFRRVAIGRHGDTAHIQFVLEKESAEDRSEISDIEFEFLALQPVGVEVETTVLIVTSPLIQIPYLGRVVFGRRE